MPARQAGAVRSRSPSTCATSDTVESDRKVGGFDAVVVGAGVIGAAIAFELGRRGRRALCVDKLPAAGFGSTVNSCAIVRFTYSTF
ncbi:MAG: FAD-dependent oxidoreductase, partial [Acidimicrobiaceae bacterium]|nr:FAD-dependent oxidoreductase [Acidimicrobiaceae bacterium]